MTSLNKQKGIALFIAMLILPLLLVLGVMVMKNTFLGLKMVDARVMLGESNIILNSATNEIMNRAGIEQVFGNAQEGVTQLTYQTVTGSVQENGEFNCKREWDASADRPCKYLQLDLSHDFGRATAGGARSATNQMSIGIQQPLNSD